MATPPKQPRSHMSTLRPAIEGVRRALARLYDNLEILETEAPTPIRAREVLRSIEGDLARSLNLSRAASALLREALETPAP